MRIVTWAVRLTLFIVLLAFAAKNTDPVVLKFYFDTAFEAPLVFLRRVAVRKQFFQRNAGDFRDTFFDARADIFARQNLLHGLWSEQSELFGHPRECVAFLGQHVLEIQVVHFLLSVCYDSAEVQQL